MTSKELNVLSLKEWKEKYQPMANPLEPGINFFRGGGEQEEFVANQDRRFVWSDSWDFYQEQFVLVNEYIPSDPVDAKTSNNNEEIYFVCSVEGSKEDFVILDDLADLRSV